MKPKLLENGLIGMLLIGILLTAGCGSSGDIDLFPIPPPTPSIEMSSLGYAVFFLGQDSRIYALYQEADGTVVEGGTWSFFASDNDITPSFTTGIFTAESGGLPLDISFTETGHYRFDFSQKGISRIFDVYVYPTPDPILPLNIGEPVTINGLTASFPLENHSATVHSTPLGILSENEATITFTPTEVGTFELSYQVLDLRRNMTWVVVATYTQTITVIDPNPPAAGTVVTAGADQVAVTGETGIFSGTAAVDGTYSAGDWHFVSGPAGATADQLFYDDLTQITPLEFTATEAGIYAFEFTDGTYSDFVIIKVSSAPAAAN